MYRFQILLNPAILSADKHGLPIPTWKRCSGGNPVIFLSGKDVFLTHTLAWSRCVVISNLSHSVSSCSTCKSLKAHEQKGLKRFFWRCLKSRYPVVSCDWRLWPVSGDAFLFVLHVIWQLFRSFSGFEELDMSYLFILGLTVLWTIQIQVSCFFL